MEPQQSLPPTKASYFTISSDNKIEKTEDKRSSISVIVQALLDSKLQSEQNSKNFSLSPADLDLIAEKYPKRFTNLQEKWGLLGKLVLWIDSFMNPDRTKDLLTFVQEQKQQIITDLQAQALAQQLPTWMGAPGLFGKVSELKSTMLGTEIEQVKREFSAFCENAPSMIRGQVEIYAQQIEGKYTCPVDSSEDSSEEIKNLYAGLKTAIKEFRKSEGHDEDKTKLDRACADFDKAHAYFNMKIELLATIRRVTLVPLPLTSKYDTHYPLLRGDQLEVQESKKRLELLIEAANEKVSKSLGESLGADDLQGLAQELEGAHAGYSTCVVTYETRVQKIEKLQTKITEELSQVAQQLNALTAESPLLAKFLDEKKLGVQQRLTALQAQEIKGSADLKEAKGLIAKLKNGYDYFRASYEGYTTAQKEHESNVAALANLSEEVQEFEPLTVADFKRACLEEIKDSSKPLQNMELRDLEIEFAMPQFASKFLILQEQQKSIIKTAAQRAAVASNYKEQQQAVTLAGKSFPELAQLLQLKLIGEEQQALQSGKVIFDVRPDLQKLQGQFDSCSSTYADLLQEIQELKSPGFVKSLPELCQEGQLEVLAQQTARHFQELKVLLQTQSTQQTIVEHMKSINGAIVAWQRDLLSLKKQVWSHSVELQKAAPEAQEEFVERIKELEEEITERKSSYLLGEKGRLLQELQTRQKRFISQATVERLTAAVQQLEVRLDSVEKLAPEYLQARKKLIEEFTKKSQLPTWAQGGVAAASFRAQVENEKEALQEDTSSLPYETLIKRLQGPIVTQEIDQMKGAALQNADVEYRAQVKILTEPSSLESTHSLNSTSLQKAKTWLKMAFAAVSGDDRKWPPMNELQQLLDMKVELVQADEAIVELEADVGAAAVAPLRAKLSAVECAIEPLTAKGVALLLEKMQDFRATQMGVSALHKQRLAILDTQMTWLQLLPLDTSKLLTPIVQKQQAKIQELQGRKFITKSDIEEVESFQKQFQDIEPLVKSLNTLCMGSKEAANSSLLAAYKQKIAALLKEQIKTINTTIDTSPASKISPAQMLRDMEAIGKLHSESQFQKDCAQLQKIDTFIEVTHGAQLITQAKLQPYIDKLSIKVSTDKPAINTFSFGQKDGFYGMLDLVGKKIEQHNTTRLQEMEQNEEIYKNLPPLHKCMWRYFIQAFGEATAGEYKPELFKSKVKEEAEELKPFQQLKFPAVLDDNSAGKFVSQIQNMTLDRNPSELQVMIGNFAAQLENQQLLDHFAEIVIKLNDFAREVDAEDASINAGIHLLTLQELQETTDLSDQAQKQLQQLIEALKIKQLSEES